MNRNINGFILICMLLLVLSSCQKQKYYYDTGLSKAAYNGTVMDYLENNPYHLFDSVVKVIKLAGMENVFQSDSITFFAPADTCIYASIANLNSQLVSRGKDTISDLAQLSPEFWKEEISLYLFSGVHRLKDYPQIDPSNMQVFPGGYYPSYNGKVMHVGVIFNTVNGVQYAGYRQLMIDYFTGSTPPTGYLTWQTLVASSDINPSNGIVHVLQYPSHFFGFNPSDFANEAIAKGIDYTK
ncbi:MAG TPA: hypothetical protein VFQ86_08645 [Arachidicoccus soli]|nr:hypothetical protein [Arachidicoccus soli]